MAKSYIPSLLGGYKVKVSWHHREIADKLNDVLEGRIKRIMFLVPPRHSKSELVSRRMPNCFLEANPDKKVLLVTYSPELAEKLGENVSKEFKDRFMAVGVESPNLGCEADLDLILIDEPIKNYKEAMNEEAQDSLFRWYNYRLECRLKSDGAVVLIMNRWGENDFAGRLLKEEPDQWEVLSFPAICYKENDNEYDPRKVGEALWPERHPIKDLERIKKSDPVIFESMWQQCPK